MWKPIRIHFERLLSHADSTYIFDQGKTFIVTGRNDTDEGQGSNGSGKSAFIEAMAIALTGDPFRKMSLKEMVMDPDYNDCLIELELENSHTGELLYIKRVLHRKKSAKAIILLDGQDQSDKFVDWKEANAYIEFLIGVTKGDLLNYYIVSREKYSSFFVSTDGAKKKIINRFSNAEMIDPVFSSVKDKYEEYSDKIYEYEGLNVKKQGTIEAYEEQLNELMAEEIDDDLIEEYTNKIVETKKSIDEHLVSMKNIKEEVIPELTQDLEAFREEEKVLKTKEESFELRKDVIRKDRTALDEASVELNHFKAHIEAIIEGKIECPSCGFEFALLDQEIDPTKAQEQLPEILEEIEGIEKSKRALNKKANELVAEENKHKSEYNQMQRELSNMEREMDNMERAYQGYEQDVSFAETTIKNLEEGINEILALNNDEKIKAVNLKIKETKIEIESNWDEIKKLEKKVAEGNSLIDHFTRFKSFLANQSISSIEGFVNNYLQRIHTNLQVMISGYRMLADGKTLKEEIEVMVLRDGLVNGKFGKFSAGEKVRIDICGILTLQGLINLNCEQGKGLDLLLIDEVADSLDYEGMSEIMYSLSSLDMNIGIISHVKDGDFDNQLSIVKVDGVSKVFGVR